MEVMQAISDRRSIRRFEDRTVPKELIERVLDAAVKAPSGKNAQPWRFIVLQGAAKDRLAEDMGKRVAFVKQSGYQTGSAEASARIMRQAPVLILVYNPNWSPAQGEGVDTFGRGMNVVDVQSVGAAIQNMLLAATDAGLGSLWICDVFYAEEMINEIADLKGGLVAAVSLGYAAESPAPRPRKTRDEVTRWME